MQEKAKRYALAIFAAAVALLLREFLSPLLGPNDPYHTVWVAVIFSAWYCGLGPSILTTLLSWIGVWYFFLQRFHSFALQDPKTEVTGMLGFLILSSFIVALGDANRRSIARLEGETQERLRAEQQFKSLANSMPALCWMATGDGHIFWYNDRWYEYTGTTPEQMLGWGWQSVHDPEMLPSVLERWNTAIQTGEHFEMEFPLRGADGVFRWFLTRIEPVFDSDRKVTRWFGTNTNIQYQREMLQSLVAARQQLEERVQERTAELSIANEGLRKLSGRLLQSQDEERRRIARELHDSAGQLLAAMKMSISALQFADLNPVAARTVTECTSLVDEMIKEIRTMSYLLHPPLLDEVGLPSALRWYVDGFSERSKITVNLDIAGEVERLGNDMEIAIFRVVQESLTNVHRHSSSQTAIVHLGREDGHVRLEIVDAGIGIPPEKQLALKSSGQLGVGFRGMRERISQLGGVLKVQSDTNGTRVVAILPVEKAAVRTASSEQVA